MLHHTMSLSPPSSPLQKMKTGFVRRSRFSIRPRSTTRASIAVLSIVCLFFTLNEIRCLKYGCVSRVGFYGGEKNVFVGGGSVIPNTNSKAISDIGWDPTAIMSSYGTSNEGEGIAKLAKLLPWVSDNDGPFAREKEEVNDGKGVLVGVDHAERPNKKGGAANGRWIDAVKENGAEDKGDMSGLETTATIVGVLSQAAVITSSTHADVLKPSAIASAETRPMKPPGLGLSKEALLKPVAASFQLEDTSKDIVVFDAPKSTEKTTHIDGGAFEDDPPLAMRPFAKNVNEYLDWDGRDPALGSDSNEGFKAGGTKKHADWKQDERQENPVHLPFRKNTTTIDTSEMKVAMSELLSAFRAT